MAKRMLVDATHPEETRVVVVDGTRLEEFDFESSTKKQLKGNIYLAKVIRIEPSLQAAFVEYGGNRHGFLAFNEIHPDYYQIPIADRERLLAEQQRERGYNGELDEDLPVATTVDKSDIVEAREEREALKIDASSSAAVDDAEELVVAAPLDVAHAAPADDTTSPSPRDDASIEVAATVAAASFDQAAEAALPPPFEPAPAVVADPAAATLPHVLGPRADNAPTAGEAPMGLQTATADSTIDVEPSRMAFEHRGDVLPGPFADARPAAAAEIVVEEEAATDVAAVTPLETTADRSLDPAEAPQPQIAVETLGGDADIAEVRRPRRPSPSRQYKIQEVIKRRQIMLVQVVKEERGNKGAALTTYLSLAGRYCVLMPNAGRGGGISRKITSALDRKRMKEMLSELEVPQGMGVILRTAGLERSKSDIRRDYEYLLRLWDGIRDLTMRSTAPALIYEESDLIKRSIRDLYNSDIDEILVEGEPGYRRAYEFMRQLVPQHAARVQTYAERIPLFHRYQVETQLDAMHSPVVQLRTGAYVVINPTEALVAIDVNSGRSTRERNIEETALRTNLEAADEIARQVRLRDLSGLIVIDFIDMEDNRHQQQVERRLKEAMRSDRARIQIGRISPFGLLELSRQRLRPSLLENFTELCVHCEGTGRIRSVESTALHVLRAIEEEGIRQRAAELVASVPVQVALYILNHKRLALMEIERRYDFRVIVSGVEDLIPPQYRIERTRARNAQGSVDHAAQAPLTASAIYQEFETDYEGEGEAMPMPSEAAEDAADGDDAGGDDATRRGRRRRRRRKRRDGSDEPQAAIAAEDEAAGVSAEPRGGIDRGDGEAADRRHDVEARVDDQGTPPAPGRSDGGNGQDRDGDRRRRRRGRRGGRNRRPFDDDTGAVDWAKDVPADGDVVQEPIDPAGEDEVELGATPPQVPADVHASETDADDSLAPSPTEPQPAPALEQVVSAGAALGAQATEQMAADAAPAPAPSSGSDFPAPEDEKTPVAEPPEFRIPVTNVDSPVTAPRRGWWSR